MIKFIFAFLFAFMLAAPIVQAGDGPSSKIQQKKRSRVNENQLLLELKSIALEVDSLPEKNISRLEEIVQTSINYSFQSSLSESYYLLGKSYKKMELGKIALKYMNLYQQNNSVDLKIRTKSKSETKAASTVEFKDEKKKAIPLKNSKQDEITVSGTTPGTKPELNIELAEIHFLLKNYKQSNTYYKTHQQRLSSERAKKDIEYSIAQNLYLLEQYQEALVIYQSLLKFEQQTNNLTNESLCHARIAACQISLGNTKEGLKDYQRSISNNGSKDADPSYYWSSNEIVSEALQNQNEFEEDAKLQQELNAILPQTTSQLKIAQSHFQAKEFDKCEQALDLFLANPSYDISDEKQLEFIQLMGKRLAAQNKKSKALNYLLLHGALSDTLSQQQFASKANLKKASETGYQKAVEFQILQKDKEISDATIQHLMEEQALQNEVMSFQKTLIYSLIVLLLIGVGTVIYIIRIAKQRRIANQQLAIRSLRSQMNPHFIFNALNSINSFISLNDERSANQFLSEFSTLMRTVMENSEHDFIPLSKELEILKLYIGLEHFRFKDKFSYTFSIDENMDEDEFLIPPMLIQPYIENAVWHGLRYKDTPGHLTIAVHEKNKQLHIVITDDGIGRKRSAELKTKNQRKTKSTAIKNIDERIKLINNLHGLALKVSTRDANQDGSGTVVTLIIPQKNKG